MPRTINERRVVSWDCEGGQGASERRRTLVMGEDKFESTARNDAAKTHGRGTVNGADGTLISEHLAG